MYHTMAFCLIFFSITVDFVIPQKGESLLEAYEKWRKWADEKGKSYCFPYLPGFTIVGTLYPCIIMPVHLVKNIILQVYAEWIWPPNK